MPDGCIEPVVHIHYHLIAGIVAEFIQGCQIIDVAVSGAGGENIVSAVIIENPEGSVEVCGTPGADIKGKILIESIDVPVGLFRKSVLVFARLGIGILNHQEAGTLDLGRFGPADLALGGCLVEGQGDALLKRLRIHGDEITDAGGEGSAAGRLERNGGDARSDIGDGKLPGEGYLRGSGDRFIVVTGQLHEFDPFILHRKDDATTNIVETQVQILGESGGRVHAAGKGVVCGNLLVRKTDRSSVIIVTLCQFVRIDGHEIGRTVFVVDGSGRDRQRAVERGDGRRFRVTGNKQPGIRTKEDLDGVLRGPPDGHPVFLKDRLGVLVIAHVGIECHLHRAGRFDRFQSVRVAGEGHQAEDACPNVMGFHMLGFNNYHNRFLHCRPSGIRRRGYSPGFCLHTRPRPMHSLPPCLPAPESDSRPCWRRRPRRFQAAWRR